MCSFVCGLEAQRLLTAPSKVVSCARLNWKCVIPAASVEEEEGVRKECSRSDSCRINDENVALFVAGLSRETKRQEIKIVLFPSILCVLALLKVSIQMPLFFVAMFKISEMNLSFLCSVFRWGEEGTCLLPAGKQGCSAP